MKVAVYVAGLVDAVMECALAPLSDQLAKTARDPVPVCVGVRTSNASTVPGATEITAGVVYDTPPARTCKPAGTLASVIAVPVETEIVPNDCVPLDAPGVSVIEPMLLVPPAIRNPTK